MAWPTKPNAGDLIVDTLLDEIIDALALWGGNVSAGGFNLSDVGTLGLVSTQPTISLRESDAGADEKLWKIFAVGGQLGLYAMNDADSSFAPLITFDRSGTTPETITSYGRHHVIVGNDTDNGVRITGNSGPDHYAYLDGRYNAGAGFLRLGFWRNGTSGGIHIDGNDVRINSSLPGPHADNTAAVAAGLTAGRLYRDSNNNVKQVQ